MMFFVWLIFLLLIGEFFYVLLFQKEEPARFNRVIKKERKFLKRMIDFDKNQKRKC